MLTELQADSGSSELDAMLVLKDILAHEYMDNRPKKSGGKNESRKGEKSL